MADEWDTKAVSQLSAKIKALRAEMRPLLEHSPSEIEATLDNPLEKARIRLAYAFSTCSLAFATLRLTGVDPTKHEVKNDIARIQTYLQRVEQAANSSAGDKRARPEETERPAAEVKRARRKKDEEFVLGSSK